MSKKQSRRVARLNDIFAELGMDTQSEPPPPKPIARHEAVRKDNNCGKNCYTSEGQCNSAIGRRLNIGANTSKLRSYFCSECQAWHMTSSFHGQPITKRK